MSDFLIDFNGFIPVPIILTEPAFGGFGLGVVPVFLKNRPAVIDSMGSGVKKIATPPDITGAAMLYTLNKSWALIGLRQGTWLKARAKYRVIAGYADMNLSFYRTSAIDGQEREYVINLKTIPLFGYLMKKVKGTHWSAGLQYLFLSTQLKTEEGGLPDFVSDLEVKSIVSMPGVIVEFDNRDNIFTPDKGLKAHAHLSWSDEKFGSDYNYRDLNVFAFAYHPLSKKVIGGLRYDLQQVFDDPPFYLLPFINLRGIPLARYQGNIATVAEGELRYDFVTRWSAVFFGGAGKAYDTWGDFKESAWHASGGAGFRYLVARKFKLRTGLDLARGPEQWAYYIVFGSSWVK
jgi:hypothetical protein